MDNKEPIQTTTETNTRPNEPSLILNYSYFVNIWYSMLYMIKINTQ